MPKTVHAVSSPVSGTYLGEDYSIPPSPGSATLPDALADELIAVGLVALHTGTFQSGVWVDDVKVLGSQAAAIAAPSGGLTSDAEARAAIGSILAALRGHGIIAT